MERSVTEIGPNSFKNGPDEHGRFGMFGGRFVAETLMPLILELERHWKHAKDEPEFQRVVAHRSSSIGR